MNNKLYESTLDWYAKNSNLYKSQHNNRIVSQELDEFRGYLNENDNVLDAGCGYGRDSNQLTQRGLNVTGLDIVRELVELAKKDYPHINFIQGDMLDLPFSNQTFDGIWSYASLLHFDTIFKTKTALHEFNRVLKTEGILLVKVKAQTSERKFNVTSDSLTPQDRFFQYYTKDELTDLLTIAGFKIITIDQFGDQEKLPESVESVAHTQWIRALAKK